MDSITKRAKFPMKDVNSLSDSSDYKSSHSVSSEPQFQYGSLLLCGLIFPIIVCFAFGGKPALIALCFGTLVAYIFDLLATVEATLVAITVTLMILWGTMIWAARLLLQDSALNVFLILLLAIVIIFVFITIAAQFRTLRMEMDSLFFFMEPILFSNISLVCSAVITWFICVELPSIDLSVCFCTVYFLYMIVFAKPRYPSSFIPMAIKNDELPIFIISQPVLQFLYLLPVITSPILHIALHYNVLETSWDRVTGIFISILYPILLMIFTAENQIDYWAVTDKSTILYLLSIAKLISALCLVLGLQSHPILDDLKIFSGLPEPLSSYAISGAIFLLFAAVYSHRQKVRDVAVLPAAGTVHADITNVWIQNIVVSICVALASVLTSLLLGLQWTGVPIVAVGAVSVAELYQRDWSSLNNRPLSSVVYLGVLVLCAVEGVMYAGMDVSAKTLMHLSFKFLWHFPLDIKQFCLNSVALAVLAILLPCIVSGTSIPHGGDNQMRSMVFGGCFVGFSVVVAVLEMIVREQDWVAVGTTVEEVYPAYLMGGTTLLFLLTSIHLVQLRVTRYDTLVSVVLIHTCKLLPLVGAPSLTASALCSMLMSYALPFSLYLSYIPADAPQTIVGGAAVVTPIVSFPVLVSTAFFASASLNSAWAASHVFPFLLSSLLSTQVSSFQCWCGAAACFFVFSVAFVTVFWKQASGLRSLLLLLSAVCTLLSTEALGPLSFAVDRSSPTYVVLSLHPELSSDQTGLFFLLTALLLLMAASNIFPIRKPVSRILFILLFSFCSAKALLGWAFPSLTGGHGRIHSLGFLSLPWIYCIVTTLLSTSTALHAALPQATSVGSWMFAMCVCVPVFAMVVCTLQGTFADHACGVLWTAAVGHGAIALSARAGELMREWLPPPPSQRQKGDKNFANSRSVCALAAVLGIMWSIAATLLSSHTPAEIAVPMFSLLLLCTKRGLLVQDTPPWALVIMSCTIWWCFCALCAIFVKKSSAGAWMVLQSPSSGLQLGVFKDQDVSIWGKESLILPLITLGFVFVPLPAIVLSFLRRREESEDLMFILTIFSSISLIGGTIWSVRLLGLVGLIYGAWRCKDVGSNKVASDRII